MRRVTPTAIDKLNLDRGENIYNGSLAIALLAKCPGKSRKIVFLNSGFESVDILIYKAACVSVCLCVCPPGPLVPGTN